MNNNKNKKNRNEKLFAIFNLHKNRKTLRFKLCGKEAQSLIALIKAKQKGVTALEVSSWALRLSAYIHILRRRYNLDIPMIRESHPGGFHGRYFLCENIDVIRVYYSSIGRN